MHSAVRETNGWTKSVSISLVRSFESESDVNSWNSWGLHACIPLPTVHSRESPRSQRCPKTQPPLVVQPPWSGHHRSGILQSASGAQTRPRHLSKSFHRTSFADVQLKAALFAAVKNAVMFRASSREERASREICNHTPMTAQRFKAYVLRHSLQTPHVP